MILTRCVFCGRENNTGAQASSLQVWQVVPDKLQQTASPYEESNHVTGEIIDVDSPDAPIDKTVSHKPEKSKIENQKYYLLYVFLPIIFLTVTMLGGLRISGLDSSFIFLKPALFCLIFAAVMLVLFFRAGLISLDSWFAEEFALVKNVANTAVLITLFLATTQLFNSLLPEQGLPFWIVAFCFFWTLWNNLFADFDTKKLLRSLGGLFGLAFVVKYLVLANLAAPASESWLRSLIENPTKEAFTWLLDLPRFAPATGYLQFFAVVFYLIGLFLLPPSTKNPRQSI